MKRVSMQRFYSILIMTVLLFVCGTLLGLLQAGKHGAVEAKSEVPRISVEEARQKTLSAESLLVCAYKDDVKCNKIRFDRGISLQEFESTLSDVSNEKEIIFYCS